MIPVAFALLCAVAVGAAVYWRRRTYRLHRIVAEWQERWFLAPDLCAIPSCHRPPEDDVHASDYDDATLRRWGKHRYLPARLVPTPDPLARPAIGRDEEALR